MDGHTLSFSPHDLYARLGTAHAPLLIDVRRGEAFEADDRQIIGSLRRLPEEVSDWRDALPNGRSVVAYCAHGHEVSQGVANALRDSGVQAAYLEGGIAVWKERKLPTRRKRGAAENKWVTREHPKIDRIACPWLISRFVNPDAEFIYVPPMTLQRWRPTRAAHLTISRASSSAMSASVVRSTPLSGLTESKIPPLIIWRPLCAAQTRLARP